MKKITLILILFATTSTFLVNGQVAINNDGSAPDPSAMLDVKSSEAGMLIPRMSAAQRNSIPGPATGLLVYVTDDNNYYYFNGVDWQQANANPFRTMNYASANGPMESVTNGQITQITSRVLTFDKKNNDTKLRISYTDNFRVMPSGSGVCSARYEIRIDGNSCPNQPLVYDFWSSPEINVHRSSTLVGYCSGIPAGTHQIQIWVSNVPGQQFGYVLTGWSDSTWVIECEEVN